MVNFSDVVNTCHTKIVEFYNALPSQQEVKQKVDDAVAFATPYAEKAVTVGTLFAKRVLQKIGQAVTYATPYVQNTIATVTPYALQVKQRAIQVFDDVCSYVTPVPAEKLTKIFNNAQALNAQVEELKKAVLLTYNLDPTKEKCRVADVLSVQVGLTDLGYKVQKTLRQLEKIKTKAPQEHKANKKIVKLAIESLCNTISQEGIKAITSLQAQMQAKMQQIRETSNPISTANDFDLKMYMNRYEQTATLISSAYAKVDALRNEIIKA